MVAADIYRPAAIDQLKTLGEKIGVEVFSMGTDADPIGREGGREGGRVGGRVVLTLHIRRPMLTTHQSLPPSLPPSLSHLQSLPAKVSKRPRPRASPPSSSILLVGKLSMKN